MEQAKVVEKKVKATQESNMAFLSQLLTVQEESSRRQEAEAIKAADHRALMDTKEAQEEQI